MGMSFADRGHQGHTAEGAAQTSADTGKCSVCSDNTAASWKGVRAVGQTERILGPAVATVPLTEE